MRNVLITAAMIVLAAALMAACGASQHSGRTEARIRHPSGLELDFDSTKPYQGVDGTYELYPDGKLKSLTLKIDQAGSEQAILQALIANSMMTNRLLELALPMLQKGIAGAAAGAGVPLPLAPRATVP